MLKNQKEQTSATVYYQVIDAIYNIIYIRVSLYAGMLVLLVATFGEWDLEFIDFLLMVCGA